MPGRDRESQEIMGAAMRYVKSGDRSGLESYSLELLQKADYQLGDRDSNSGYRNAIKERIAELKEQKIVSNKDDLFELKPNVYGVGVDLKKLWCRFGKKFFGNNKK